MTEMNMTRMTSLAGAPALAIAIALASSAALPTQAAPVTYEITGNLVRQSTLGVSIEAYIAAIGFDGGSFRATFTLDTGTIDSDPLATRGAYLGAVTASSLQVAGTVFSGSGFCNLDPSIRDCSVEALNDHSIIGVPALLQDAWRVNSEVFEAADIPGTGLPAGFIDFLTFDLAVDSAVGPAPALFDGTDLELDLTRLGSALSQRFGLDLRGFDPTSNEEFGVFWRSDAIRVTRVSDVPEPGTSWLALAALGLAWRLRAARPAALSAPASGALRIS